MTNTNVYIAALLALPLLGGLSARGQTARVGDDGFRLAVDVSGDLLRETGYTVTGRSLPGLSAVAFKLRVNGREFLPVSPGRADAPPGELAFQGATELFQWLVRYQPNAAAGRVTRFLNVTAKTDIIVEEVTAWSARHATAPVVPRTSLQDIAAIFRGEQGGMFVSLDFPYSRIVSDAASTSISYPPHCRIRAGETYQAHSVTFGATRLTGRLRCGHDEGEVAAVDAYVQERHTPRFDRPMLVSCSIVNRYTQPRAGVIWASMKDHPTLCDNTDLLERELALMPRLGVEHYQVFPGVFDWGPDDPPPAQVDRLMNVARAHGVRMGDYSGTSSVFCGHYNEYGNSLNHPEWRINPADGKPAGVFCFGCSAFVDHYINTVVPNCKRFGFEIHCLDFLNIQPCHATNHDHPVGRDSIYAQVRGLVRLLEAINGVSPQMMTWSNSGNWSELLPKIAWANPNLYLTDPFISTNWQGLNMTRLLDDARREQMVGLHWTRFVPYRFLTNCQYFFSQNSIVPDIRHYEYGALSTLAVTPNLCLGEIRPWLDRLSEADRERVIAFYAKWTAFVREHYAIWKKTFQVGENPGPGAVEVYAHAAGDHGYVFLVNPQYWSRTVAVPLDERLGFAGTGRCEIAELYPRPRLRLTSQGPFAALGSEVSVDVPAQQVIVLEVRPAPAAIEEPRLYGLTGTVERKGDGLLVKATGPQGRTERGVIVLPDGKTAVCGAEVRPDVPRIVKRLRSPTPLRFWPTPNPGAVLDVTFRGAPAADELRDWNVRAGTLAEGTGGEWHKGFDDGLARFPLPFGTTQTPGEHAKAGPLAGFCGAYVENAFSEPQETWIELRTGTASGGPTSQPVDCPVPTPPQRPGGLVADPRTDWWLQTRFMLPFMYTIGAEPFFDEHTILVLPMRQPQAVKRIDAWINGARLDVRLYRYPCNRGLCCYYADLVGTGARGGENTLVLSLSY